MRGPVVRGLALLGVLGGAACHAPPLARRGDLVVTDGYGFPSMGSGASAFLVIRNEGSVPDTIVAVTSPAAEAVSPHGTETAGGAGRMVHLSRIPVPPGETLRMGPGGLHLMLQGVRRPLSAGDSCVIVMTLVRAGSITVTVPVVGFADRP